MFIFVQKKIYILVQIDLFSTKYARKQTIENSCWESNG